MSSVICHMSHVICHIFFYKVVKLVGGGWHRQKYKLRILGGGTDTHKNTKTDKNTQEDIPTNRLNRPRGRLSEKEIMN